MICHFALQGLQLICTLSCTNERQNSGKENQTKLQPSFLERLFLPRHWERSPQAFQLLPPQIHWHHQTYVFQTFCIRWKSSQLNYVFTRPMIRDFNKHGCSMISRNHPSQKRVTLILHFCSVSSPSLSETAHVPLPLNWDERTKLLLDPQICQHCLRRQTPNPQEQDLPAPASFM